VKKFKLSKMGSGKIGVIHAKRKYEKDYERLLLRMIKLVVEDTLKGTKYQKDGRNFILSLIKNVLFGANKLFDELNIDHTGKWKDAVKKGMGIDLGAVIEYSDSKRILSLTAKQNAALIKDIAESTVNKISALTSRHQLEGGNIKAFRADLEKIFNFSKNRAKLVAQDQMAKLNATLTRNRHEQAGIRRYRWRSVGGIRVRPLNREHNGNIYRYDKGASDGNPGQPIRCRCVASPILE